MYSWAQLLPSGLDKLKNFAFAGVPAVAAGKEEGELGEFRTKLLSFLDTSTSYEPAKLISDFPFDGQASVAAGLARE